MHTEAFDLIAEASMKLEFRMKENSKERNKRDKNNLIKDNKIIINQRDVYNEGLKKYNDIDKAT